MKRLLPVVLLLSLFAFAGAALALDKPTIKVPADGDALGPSYSISGSMPHRALLVVMTDCIQTDTGKVMASVPGIRHWTDSDNAFHFRCASPRVSIGPQVPLTYRVHCFEVVRSGEVGPDAVVECHSAP